MPVSVAVGVHGAVAAREIVIWLVLMTFLSLLTLVLRWYGQGFEYRGQLAAATHELRMRLGEQLRSMPLTTLQSARAGDINALLLGSVDENLNYMLAIVNQLLLAIVTPVVIALVMLLVEWRLGVSLLLIFPAIALLYRWRRPAFARTMQALAEANQQTSADIVEYVQGLAVLRTSCQKAERTSALRQRFQHLQQIQNVGSPQRCETRYSGRQRRGVGASGRADFGYQRRCCGGVGYRHRCRDDGDCSALL